MSALESFIESFFIETLHDKENFEIDLSELGDNVKKVVKKNRRHWLRTIAKIIAHIILFIILIVAGQFLFNHSIAKIFTNINPINTGQIILFRLLIYLLSAGN